MSSMTGQEMAEEAEAVLTNEDYQERADAEQDQMFDAPFQRKGDSLFSLFQKVWRTKDSSKVANLNNTELGMRNISVRDAQYLALLATTMKHQKFAEFFMFNAEMILATSASKKGWFTELFVSQKKYTQRAASYSSGQQQQTPNKWTKLFSSNNNNPQPHEAFQ